jgi:hypothetical protein
MKAINLGLCCQKLEPGCLGCADPFKWNSGRMIGGEKIASLRLIQSSDEDRVFKRSFALSSPCVARGLRHRRRCQ